MYDSVHLIYPIYVHMHILSAHLTQETDTGLETTECFSLMDWLFLCDLSVWLTRNVCNRSDCGYIQSYNSLTNILCLLLQCAVCLWLYSIYDTLGSQFSCLHEHMRMSYSYNLDAARAHAPCICARVRMACTRRSHALINRAQFKLQLVACMLPKEMGTNYAFIVILCTSVAIPQCSK